MKLTLPYPPSVNHYWILCHGRVLLTGIAKKYKEKVALLCQAERLEPLDGNVAVDLKVYRPARRGDLDNTLKVSLDSLKGYCFHDDKQIVKIVAERFEDKNNPRIEIEVMEFPDYCSCNQPVAGKHETWCLFHV